MKRFWGDVIAAVGFIGLAGWIIWYSWGFPAGGQNFSNFAAISIIAMSIAMILKAVCSKDSDMKRLIIVDFSWASNKQYYVALSVIFYWLLSFVFGYFVMTFVFLLAAAWMSGIREVKTLATTAVFLLPALYGLFILILQADMPQGMFF
jgi:hypothetical protein